MPYFGALNPGYEPASYRMLGTGGDDYNFAQVDASLVLTAPANATIKTIEFGADSAASQAGGTVDVGIMDITAGVDGASIIATTTINLRSDNADYVWHSKTGLNIPLTTGHIYAICLAKPSLNVFVAANADDPLISGSKSSPGTTSLSSTWTADEASARNIPLRASYDVSSTTIDSGTNPVSLGSTGNTINTTGLGTLTSLTIGGVSVSSLSATGGDGTYSVPAWADGVAGIPLGTGKAFVAGDGTQTASSTRDVNPPSGRDWVQLTSVNSSTGYLGAHTAILKVGTQITFPTNTSLSVTTNYIDVDGGIYTDYSGSQVLHARDPDTNVVTFITLINGVPSDTTPDPFTFTDVTNATISTQYTSNTITVSGINAASPISISGGTYSVNGGGYTASSGNVNNGDTVTVRVTSSGSFSTAVNATLTIGGVSDTYTVTTVAAGDTTPNPFTFSDVTNASLSTQYTSNTITVSGIDTASPISITGGTYSINGGAYTASSGTVTNGQTVNVRVTSSASFSTAVNATLTIGGVSDTYTVTTLASDTTPDSFTFTDVTGVALSSVQTSNTITVSGINSAAAISITGGTYSVNGGAYTSSAGTVTNGQTVSVRVTASSSFSTAVNAVLTIGGVSDTYTVTTLAADTTPNAFSFTDVTNATLSTVYTSNTITVSGINTLSSISITGGTYNKNGGAFTASSGTVVNGDTVSVRVTSSASYSTPVNSVLTIGGVSDTYTVTTLADPGAEVPKWVRPLKNWELPDGSPKWVRKFWSWKYPSS